MNKFDKNIKSINLNHKNLTELPSYVCDLKKLKILNLKFNDLTCLPDDIVKLKYLKIIDLSYNNFSEYEKMKTKKMLPNVDIYW